MTDIEARANVVSLDGYRLAKAGMDSSMDEFVSLAISLSGEREAWDARDALVTLGWTLEWSRGGWRVNGHRISGSSGTMDLKRLTLPELLLLAMSSRGDPDAWAARDALVVQGWKLEWERGGWRIWKPADKAEGSAPRVH